MPLHREWTGIPTAPPALALYIGRRAAPWISLLSQNDTLNSSDVLSNQTEPLLKAVDLSNDCLTKILIERKSDETMNALDETLLKMNARAAAQERVLRILVKALSPSVPELRESLQACISEISRPGSGNTIPGIPAEYSMMVAGESDEAFADLVKSLLSYCHPN